MKTMNFAQSVTGVGDAIQANPAPSASGDSTATLDKEIPDGVVNAEVSFPIDPDSLEGICIYSDKDIKLDFAGKILPIQANNIFAWTKNGYTKLPTATSVDDFGVTNTSGEKAMLRIRTVSMSPDIKTVAKDVTKEAAVSPTSETPPSTADTASTAVPAKVQP